MSILEKWNALNTFQQLQIALLLISVMLTIMICSNLFLNLDSVSQKCNIVTDCAQTVSLPIVGTEGGTGYLFYDEPTSCYKGALGIWSIGNCVYAHTYRTIYLVETYASSTSI
jgi:hypothetical protein